MFVSGFAFSKYIKIILLSCLNKQLKTACVKMVAGNPLCFFFKTTKIAAVQPDPKFSMEGHAHHRTKNNLKKQLLLTEKERIHPTINLKLLTELSLSDCILNMAWLFH
jgi:hypothetical protein